MNHLSKTRWLVLYLLKNAFDAFSRASPGSWSWRIRFNASNSSVMLSAFSNCCQLLATASRLSATTSMVSRMFFKLRFPALAASGEKGAGVSIASSNSIHEPESAAPTAAISDWRARWIRSGSTSLAIRWASSPSPGRVSTRAR